MNKNKYIILALAVALILSASILYKNSYNDERNIYIALFKQFQSSANLKQVAFVSVVSTCNVQSSEFKGASELLFKSFYSANNKTEKPADFSIYSSLVNIAKNPDPEINSNVNLKHNLVTVTRIGFNLEKDEALVCVQSNTANFLAFFKKNNLNWKLSKYNPISIK